MNQVTSTKYLDNRPILKEQKMLYPLKRQGSSVAMPVTFARVLIAACSLARSMMKTLYDDSHCCCAWSDAEVCRIGLQLRRRGGEHGRALSERMARVDRDGKKARVTPPPS